MQNYQTVKSVKNLEITSACNLKCPYCPQREQHKHRPIMHMTEEVFERSLFWIKRFVKQNTQRELNFFGVGESTLHPRFLEYAERTRKALPRYLQLLLNTNGIAFTEQMCRELKRIGVDKIDLTDHEAEASMRTIRIFRKVGMRYGYSRDAITNPNDWGGLVKWTGLPEGEVDYQKYICPWLDNGQTMIMSDGRVTRCCQDAFARGIIGHVDDDNLTEIPYGTFVQCVRCHEIVPERFKHEIQEKKKEAAG